MVLTALLPLEALANRLDDDVYRSRCYTADLTAAQCADLRDYAYETDCVTLEEYDYANTKKLAPICTPFPPVSLVAVCPCGCFEEGTNISTVNRVNGNDQLATIEDIVNNYSSYEAYTVVANSTLTSLSYEPRGFDVVTDGVEEKPLVVVLTESGKRIGLSSRHGVLLISGTMTTATELSVGDVLVQADGSPDPIVSIEQGPVGEIVYNVLTETDDESGASHLIVAQGLIMGDLYWQNILDSEFRRFKIRQ